MSEDNKSAKDDGLIIDGSTDNDEHVDPQDAGSFTHLGDGDHLKSKAGETGFGLGYTKVSAEELRDQMRRRKEVNAIQRREAAARRSPVFSVARMAVTAVAILGAVGSIMYVVGTAGDFDKQSQANNDRIAALKSELDTINSSTKNSLDGAALNNAVDQAKVAAKALADIQNDMAKSRLTPTMDKPEVDEKSNTYVASVNDAKKYITKNAQSSGTFEPQQRWIAPQMSTEVVDEKAESENPDLVGAREKKYVLLPDDRFTWIAHGTYSVDPATNRVPVIWSCITTDAGGGKLLAWTAADFDPSTGLFDNFRMSLTPAGKRVSQLGTPSVSEAEKSQNEADVLELEKLLKGDAETQRLIDEQQQRKSRNSTPTTSAQPSSGAKPSTQSPTKEGR